MVPVWWKALRWANWRRLIDDRLSNVLFGAVVCLLLLWTLRTDVQPGFTWHLSGIVTLTLMFGWSFAILGGTLSLVGVSLAELNDWRGFLPSVVVEVLLPATVTQVLLGLVRAYLPKHFFIYVFINAFFCGGLVSLLIGLATAALMVTTGAYEWQKLEQTYLVFLPLMFFPEAFVNGFMMTILVGFQPRWVWSFRDEEYLQNR